jgi:hypothetical protein
MSYKQKLQTEQNIFPKQQNQTRGKTPHGGVGQDKRAASSARTALRQASRSAAFPRAQSLRKEVVRAPLVISGRRKKEKITVWVEPVVKTELERRAKRNGLSLSATGGELLTQALQANIDMQYGASGTDHPA